jgi:bifunctional polynucleotide phosphatase/kinase
MYTMWERDGSLWVYTGPRWAAGTRLALFDFDSTLTVCRGSGPPEELTLSFLAVLSRDAGWQVVIFTNRGRDTDPAIAPLRSYVGRLEEAGGSCDVYAATARDRNRKPQVGAWERFLARRRGGRPLTPLERAQAFFCGDAAGRACDFASSDRNFASNIGVRFRVPQQLFGMAGARGAFAGTIRDDPPPADHPDAAALEASLEIAGRPESWARTLHVLNAAAESDVVMLVGSPASGKTYLARWLAETRGFTIASQDLQGTRARCRAFARLALGRGQPQAGARRAVVLDNTHRTAAARSYYTAMLRKHCPRLSIVLIWLDTPRPTCLHLDGLRCNSDPTGGTRLLPRVAIASYWAQLEPPQDEEADIFFRLDFAVAPDAPPGVLRDRFI